MLMNRLKQTEGLLAAKLINLVLILQRKEFARKVVFWKPLKYVGLKNERLVDDVFIYFVLDCCSYCNFDVL